ncbi:MAG: hypothetical protein IPP78_00860 [Holophagaceae bacterium]|nr:hypothetical protein [Holophagaceae bacterium]
MQLRPIIRQSIFLLVLGVGLQAPALDAGNKEGSAGLNPWPEGQERGEGRAERRETRPEQRENRQERREARPERREERQERREDRQERREERHLPPVPTRSQPMPRPQPPPFGGQLRGAPQSRPSPRSVDRSDPGGTNLSHDNRYSPPSRSRNQAQTWERSHGWRAEGAWGSHPTWQGHRARSWESEHRTWAHRGGYGGYIIPEPQFRVHFGPERWFRIRTRPVIHMGYPRFHYGNYWFLIVDPWPEFWSDSWYANDDVYIDYNDGYYLHNRHHPGVAIAISVSL